MHLKLFLHKSDISNVRYTYMDIEKGESRAWITTFKQMFDKCCFTS